MTTNFYWREPACPAPCKHCRGADVLHIGQRSSGGGWSFQGHFVRDDAPLLVSFVDWVAFLRSDAGRSGWVEDEYGVQHDVDAFLADVEAVPAEGRRRQHDWLVAHPDRVAPERVGPIEPGCDWLDADGFSFHGGEFT